MTPRASKLKTISRLVGDAVVCLLLVAGIIYSIRETLRDPGYGFRFVQSHFLNYASAAGVLFAAFALRFLRARSLYMYGFCELFAALGTAFVLSPDILKQLFAGSLFRPDPELSRIVAWSTILACVYAAICGIDNISAGLATEVPLSPEVRHDAAEQSPNHALQRTGAAVTPAASIPPPSPIPPDSGSASGAGR